MEKNITINSDDMTSYMEDEIHNILSNITQEEYKSLKDIRERKHEAIEAIFYKFRHYEKNKENKDEAYIELENYECVTIDEINPGDYLKYFNTRIFYDLKVANGGTVVKKNVNDNNELLLKMNKRLSIIKPTWFFRHIKKDVIVKMQLFDIINDRF